MKKIMAGILAAMMCLALTACGNSNTDSTASGSEESSQVSVTEEAADTQTFTTDGFTITLPKDFKETTISGYTVAYTTMDTMVIGLKETKSSLEPLNLTSVDEYLDVLRTNNASRAQEMFDTTEEDGVRFFEYTFFNTSYNLEYKYFTTAVESDDAYWMVQFATTSTNYDANKSNFIEWAKSISVE